MFFVGLRRYNCSALTFLQTFVMFLNMINRFKLKWEIQSNWQLVFPLFAVIALFFTSFKIVGKLLNGSNKILIISLSALLCYLLIKFFGILITKLETKWRVNYRWELIRIFIVFALTGSTSAFVARPLIKYIGLNPQSMYPLFYWILYIIIGVVFYQILLVSIGWLFGQKKFFWEFEKKMLRRFGLGKYLK